MKQLLGCIIFAFVMGLSPSWAATYYTSKSATNGFVVGSDSNNCTALSTPCLTVNGAITGKMSGGDTLRINDGTYAEEITTIPSSTSYAAATQIQGYLGASSAVTIRPANGSSRAITLSNKRYIIITDIIFDGTSQISDTAKVDSASDHIRFQRVTFQNGTNQGLLWAQASFIECLTCISKNNGTNDSQHGIYISDSDSCLVQGGEHFGNAGGGVQIARDSPTGNVSEKIVSHNNKWGIIDADENGNTMRNNILYANTAEGLRIISASGEAAYNNSIYGNGAAGIYLETDTSGILLINNLSFGNVGAGITANGSGHTQTTNQTTDPSWTNAAAHDFTLQAGSTARDTGTDLSGTGFSTDALGVSRVTWDKGAFEYVVPPPTRSIGLSGVVKPSGSVRFQ